MTDLTPSTPTRPRFRRSRSRVARIALGSAGIAAGLLCLMAPDQAHAKKCNWTVKGRLSVKHRASMAALGDKDDLQNIQVRVKAMSKAMGAWTGKWGSWGTVRTDASGNFTVTKTKGCGDRRFRVEVKFDDADLEVRHANATSSTTKVKWYTVINDVQRSAGTYDIGRKYFDGSSANDLKNSEAWAHASIWVLYKDAIDHMAAMGSSYAFDTKIKVKYPHNGVAGDSAEESYANPTTKVIYIVKNPKKDRLTPGTLLHEMGHIWAYNHSKGEICLTETLVMTQDTHGIVDDHCVAFHEGFGDYFSEELQRALLGDDLPLPYGRGWLDNRGANSLSKVERYDDGWRNVFRTLRLDDPWRYDFNASGTVSTKPAIVGSCEGPNLTFKNVLSAFNPKSSAGYDKELDRADTTIDGFLSRLAAISSKFTPDHKSAYKKLANPTKTDQPQSLLCEELKQETGLVRPLNTSKPRVR